MRLKTASIVGTLACLLSVVLPIALHQNSQAAPTNYSLFSDYIPAATPVYDAKTELGVSAYTTTAGQITAIRFYQYWDGTSGNTGAHTGYIWTGKIGSTPNTLLASKRFATSTDTPTASGWVEVALDSPVSIGANETFTVSVSMPDGYYTRDSKPASKVSGPLSLAGTSYRYNSEGVFPDTNSGTNYGVDFVFRVDPVKVIIDPASTDSYSGSGTSVTDLASGLTGTMSNVNFRDQFCGVFEFTGSGRIDFPRTNFGSLFSVSAWIKPLDGTTDIQTLIANGGNGYGSNGFKGFWRNGAMVLENGNGGAGSQKYTANNVIVSGEWQHVVYTFNKSTGAVTLYRNGTLLASSGAGIRADAGTDQAWWLGAMSGTSFAMQAQLGVLKIYSKVLTDSEVSSDYNETRLRYTNSPTCSGTPPSNTSAPTVTGEAKIAATLTATSGTWSGSPTISYQWQNSTSASGSFTDIAFATSSTYIPKGESLGKYVRVNVTATQRGVSTSVASGPTAQIALATTPAATPCHLGGPCVIGDIGPGSGVVFYVSNSGFACGPTLAGTCKYLEAARDYWNNLSDDFASTAGAYFYDQRNPKGLIGANAQGTAIGTGYRNTRAAIAFPLDASNRAVHVADSYSVSPFGSVVDDWYLPAKDELLALYSNRPNSLLSFPPGAYWSSTESDASQVGEVNFSNGAWNPNYATFNYDGVRPIRAFSSTITVPAVPTLSSVTGGDRRATLTFTPGSDGGSAITDYQYSLNGETFTAMNSTTSPFTILTLLGRAIYSIRIRAQNALGFSDATSSISATTTNAALDASEAEAARLAAVAAEEARLAAIEAQRVADEKAKKEAEEKTAAELKAKADADAAAALKAKLEADAKTAEEAKIKAELEAKIKADADKKAAELKAKEEADKKKAAELKAKEEADKKAADLKAKEEADKRAADLKAKEEADKKAAEAAPSTVATAEVLPSGQAAAEISSSVQTPGATVETTQLNGKYVSSALSAGGNKVALKLSGLKVGAKIVLTLKRSVR